MIVGDINTTQEIVGNAMTVGPRGPQGIQGLRGYSNYEIAVQQGYEGTEAEWLESLEEESYNYAQEQFQADINSKSSQLDTKISKLIYKFNNVAEMKAANYFNNGDVCLTLGYYSANDGGAATYKIRTKIDSDTIDDGSIINISNTLVAELIITDKIYSSQFGVKADNSTDNISKLGKMINFVNGYEKFLNVIFDGSNIILFSDTLKFKCNNKKFILETDLQLTKTENRSATNSQTAFEICGSSTTNMIYNIEIDGKGHYIDGNGKNNTLNYSTTSGLYNAKTLLLKYINGLILENIIIKNGYKDCCGVSDSINVLVDNCKFIESYRDNGFSIVNEELGNINVNSVIKNCYAYKCRDLGFTNWKSSNIIFENCISEECGNEGETDYDNTFVSVGGGFSAEIPSSQAGTGNSFCSTTYINCKAVNCKNYGFYSNLINASYDGCEVKNITKTDTTSLRKGHGFVFEDQVSGIVKISNSIINCSNVYSNITFTGAGKSVYPTRNNGMYLKNISIIGNNDYAIYGTKIDNFLLENSNLQDTDKNIQIKGESTSYRGIVAKINNVYTKSNIELQNLNNYYIQNVQCEYSATEEKPYCMKLLKANNLWINDVIANISNATLTYAIRTASNTASEKIVNVYEGSILTNLENTIDKDTHS